MCADFWGFVENRRVPKTQTSSIGDANGARDVRDRSYIILKHLFKVTDTALESTVNTMAQLLDAFYVWSQFKHCCPYIKLSRKLQS